MKKKKKIFIIILFTALFLNFLYFILKDTFFSKKNKQNFNIVQTNTWKSITPGRSNYQQTINQLGKPIKTTQTDNAIILEYNSNFPENNQVVINKNNQVQLIKEYLTTDKKQYLDSYINKYGEPELVLCEHQANSPLRANIFLEQGIIVWAHMADGYIQQYWYFVPKDSEDFIKEWQGILSEDCNRAQ